MAVYHESKKGDMVLCPARIKCRLKGDNGEEAFHVEASSSVEARNLLEQKNGKEKETFVAKKVQNTNHNAVLTQTYLDYVGAGNPKLSSVMPTELMKKMIKERYVKESAHPDDPRLRIYCYSPETQFEGKWNDATKSARGLVVRLDENMGLDDAVVVARPWKKFFTLQQVEEGWSLGDDEEGAHSSANDELSKIDFEAEAEVTDKLDGSMGILYLAPDGKPAVATKGSFDATVADYFTKFLRKDEKLLEATEGLMNRDKETGQKNTYLFEMVSPNNLVVLPYEKDDLIFTGAVDNTTGVYKATSEFKSDWEDKGLTVAERFDAKNLKEALEIPDRDNKEGLVIRFKTDDPDKQLQIKVKQEDYKALHKIVTYNSVSNRAATDIFHSKLPKGQTLERLLKAHENQDPYELKGLREIVPKDTIPQEYKDRMEQMGFVSKSVEEKYGEVFSKTVLPLAKEVHDAYTAVQEELKNYDGSDPREFRKSFALKHKDSKNSNLSKRARMMAMSMMGSHMDGKNILENDYYQVIRLSSGKLLKENK